MTVTGKTLAENLARRCPGSRAGQKIDPRRSDDPIKATGHIQILRGNLAPDGAVAKITGKEGLVVRRPRAGLRLRRGHARARSSSGESARAT